MFSVANCPKHWLLRHVIHSTANSNHPPHIQTPTCTAQTPHSYHIHTTTRTHTHTLGHNIGTFYTLLAYITRAHAHIHKLTSIDINHTLHTHIPHTHIINNLKLSTTCTQTHKLIISSYPQHAHRHTSWHTSFIHFTLSHHAHTHTHKHTHTHTHL